MRLVSFFVNIYDYKVADQASALYLGGMTGIVERDGRDGRGGRERLMHLLLRMESAMSVQQLAGRLGISRNAAHQHVVALERDGLIARAEIVPTKGRPSQGYRLSEAGKAHFPRQYALLSRELVEELTERLGPVALKESMAAIGARLAERISDGRLFSLAEIDTVMRELGYESRQSGSDALEQEIVAHNCVFHDVALREHSVCALDLALLGKLSGRAVEHKRCMARGDASCRFVFARE